MDRLVWFLFSFDGRIGRLGFWLYSIVALSVMVPLILTYEFTEPAVVKGAAPEISGFSVFFFIVVFIVYMWTTYAVQAKRWHDRNKSGWWSLISFVPYVGNIWLLVECGFLRGMDGPNQYGEDPRAESLVEVFE